MRDKRGLSAIVATLLIILLAIIAFAIVSVVIRNTVGNSAEKIELNQKCLEVEIHPTSIIKVVGTNFFDIGFERTISGETINGIKIILTDNESNIISTDLIREINTLDKWTEINISFNNGLEFIPEKITLIPFFLRADGEIHYCDGISYSEDIVPDSLITGNIITGNAITGNAIQLEYRDVVGNSFNTFEEAQTSAALGYADKAIPSSQSDVKLLAFKEDCYRTVSDYIKSMNLYSNNIKIDTTLKSSYVSPTYNLIVSMMDDCDKGVTPKYTIGGEFTGQSYQECADCTVYCLYNSLDTDAGPGFGCQISSGGNCNSFMCWDSNSVSHCQPC